MTRPGSSPGRAPCRGRRARCRGAARDRNRRRARPSSNTAAASTTPGPDSANEPRPSTTVSGPSPLRARLGRRPAARLGDSPDLAVGPPASSAADHRGVLAGTVGEATPAAIELVEVRRGESSTIRDAVVERGVAKAQEQDRQLLLEVGAEDRRPCRRARHASSMVAWGTPSTSSAGRPSPSWESTLSVPITPLASLAQA